jgi:hypothetical protein
MRKRHFWAALVLAVCSSYSYSEELVFGQTPNAAAAGYNWVMKNILPQQAGLEVNAVVYRYTTVKDPKDDMIVSIQNLNAKDTGYIFRSVDNWSGLPGNTIQKSVAVPNVLIDFWGDGEIDIQGKGEVKDAFVAYSYQFNPCFDPQSDPSCPGYKIPVEFTVEVTPVQDPLDDDFVKQQLEKKVEKEDETEKENQRRRVSEQKANMRDRLEVALSANIPQLMNDEAEKQEMAFFALAQIPSAYEIDIPGGVYNETIRLVDSKLPDNPRALRNNWAQQLLHEQMVDLQYKSLDPK